MRNLTLLLATTALALAPIAAEAGNLRTIGLHTSPPVLTTGITAKPMIQFTTPIVRLPTDPATPPVAGEGGYDPGTPANEGGSDPGTPEPTDPPYVPTTPSEDDEEDDPFKP